MSATDTAMFRSLRNRFLVLNMTLTSLILIAAFTAVYVTTSASTRAQNQRDLESLVEMRVSVSASDGSASDVVLSSHPEEPPPLLPQNTGDEMVGTVVYDEGALTVIGTERTTTSVSTFAVLVDGAGNILAVDSPLDLPQETYEQAAAQALGNPSRIVELLDRQWLYNIIPAGTPLVLSNANGASVTISGDNYLRFLDITDSQTALRNLLLTLIVVGLAALVAVGAVSLLFANRSIKPIARAWEQQRRFVADASHELKTPLSIITANSDALLANQEQTVASQREWLDYLRIGTDRMGSLIDELLTFARVEEAGAPRSTEEVDLSTVAQTVLRALETTMKARRLQVTVDIEPGLTRVLEPGLADKVFYALVENAAEYTDEGGEVEMSLRSEEGVAVFTVKNSGPGIAAEDLPHIFERFYRADRVRRGDGKSFGLGLSIAQEVARRLGGEIDVQSSVGESTRFTVRL
jgi:signal transduction histidine kinase